MTSDMIPVCNWLAVIVLSLAFFSMLRPR